MLCRHALDHQSAIVDQARLQRGIEKHLFQNVPLRKAAAEPVHFPQYRMHQRDNSFVLTETMSLCGPIGAKVAA
jgi:hypothetical protein